MDYKNTKYQIRPLAAPKKWRDFLGHIPGEVQWTMLIFGNPHSGKSTFAMILAEMLSYFGDVLIANEEENLIGGTIQIKARRNRLDLRKVDFIDEIDGDVEGQFDNEDDIFECVYNRIVKKLQSKKYKYCIIDSISVFAETKREINKTLNLKRKFPDTSFIYVNHMTKDDKTYIGPSSLKHKVDIAIKTKDGVADCSPKNRYKDNNKNMTINFFKKI